MTSTTAILLVVIASFMNCVLSKDICSASDTGFRDDELAVACYTGNFMVKMLTELNSGQNKTVEHVRVHLLPYLGGEKTLKALLSDDPDTPTCTVCYTDKATSEGLTQLRNSLSSDQLEKYDGLKVCYALLTQRLLTKLPTSTDGIWLLPTKQDAFEQSVALFHQILKNPSFNPNSCPKQ